LFAADNPKELQSILFKIRFIFKSKIMVHLYWIDESTQRKKKIGNNIHLKKITKALNPSQRPQCTNILTVV
jgi:hypothetical protein